MDTGILYLLVPVVTLIILGVLFLINNPNDKNNAQFSVISFALSLWVASNYLADFDADNSLLWTRFAFLSIVLASGSFLLFALSYPPEGAKSNRVQSVASVATLFVALLCMTELIIPDIRYVDGVSNVVTGKYYFVFVIFLVLAMSFAIGLLVGSRRRAKGIDKRRIGLILLGVAIMTGISSVTNLIAPLITGVNPLATTGSFSTVFFVGTTYYVISRHQFLDVRSLVARSLAYLFLLGSLTIIYAVIFYGTSALFIDTSNISVSQQVMFAAIAVIISVTVQPIRTVFDRLTKKIFFRDSYDSQKILDQLSSLLATEIDLKAIVSQSSEILSSALKPLYIRFAVFKDGETYVDHKLGDANRVKFSRSDVNDFLDVVVSRESVSGAAKKFFKSHNAEILLKLRTNEETVGVILLGPKQSGTVYSKQDIDLLTISEKELAIAVQNSRYFEQIQEFNVKLQKEVTDATSELRASNTKLKELDEAKDEFISMASHQLRTPLTSVKGYISMVNEGDAGKVTPAQRKLLDEAFASSQRMVYLIADLLNVSRLRTGKFVIEPSEVYLPDVVREEVHQLEPTARSRKLKLIFDKPARFPKVWLDETKIRQVVMNFIDNAIYYTPAGGRIEIRLTAKKDGIEYTVKDNGIGVPKEEQAKLFTKFYRAGNAKQARPDGTGLGLYMAQRVVSAQGGSVVFRSEPGKGSTFGFFFPFKSVKTKQSLEKVATTKQNQSEPSEL